MPCRRRCCAPGARGRASPISRTAAFGPWLYRIATNTCLDTIKSKKRKLTALGSYAEVPWLQPYPDVLLDELADPGKGPDATVVARETIELAYLAVIQLLPARQRAVLLLRDVLGWSAAETADALELSVPAADQRAPAGAGDGSAALRRSAHRRGRLADRRRAAAARGVHRDPRARRRAGLARRVCARTCA